MNTENQDIVEIKKSFDSDKKPWWKELLETVLAGLIVAVVFYLILSGDLIPAFFLSKSFIGCMACGSLNWFFQKN